MKGFYLFIYFVRKTKLDSTQIQKVERSLEALGLDLGFHISTEYGLRWN